MSSDTRSNINKFSRMTNDTLKSMTDDTKKHSDSALSKEKDKEQQNIDILLKDEMNMESSNDLNPYDNTPSKKVNKLRSFSLTNSAHSTKLLEKLVQGQTDNEFTRATLTYQETSLKILEEIKLGVNSLATPKQEAKQTVELEREVSSLATAIAELNIPALYKELKKSAIRTFDKNGVIDSMSMVYEMIASTLGDKSGMMDMAKGKIKKGVLTGIMGKNGAHFVDKFEQDPVNAIQDYINMMGTSNNQLARSFFKRSVRGVEIKKPGDTRNDMNDVMSLNDKLTYNTINYRLPETLDRIEAAITGNEKRSYDYASNRMLSDTERLGASLKQSKIIDLRSSSEEILSSLKDNIESMFEDGQISLSSVKHLVQYDEKTREIKKDDRGRIKTKDDEFISGVMLAITKSKADLNMLINSNPELFMREYNIKPIRGDKDRTIGALQTIKSMLQASGNAFTDELDSDIRDLKENVSNMDFFDSVYANMNKEQMSALSKFTRNEISKDEFMKLVMSNSSNGKSAGMGTPRFSNTSTLFTVEGGYVIDPNKVGRDKAYKEIEDTLKPPKNATDIVLNGSTSTKEDNYKDRLNYLINQGVVSETDLAKAGYTKDSNNKFTMNSKFTGLVDSTEVKFKKANELFNHFVAAKQIPSVLAANTGQSEEFWIKQGYPTCAADLYKFITIDPVTNEAIVDYAAMGKMNARYNVEYIDSLKRNYRTHVNGVNVDITNPEKTMSSMLNETFKDPEVNRRLGIQSGSAAGYMLGKLMLNKGMITSPMAPYILGGLGGALMNMESVQKRINAILGPEGSLKGESGYSNREIAVAKFMNKALPMMGVGGAVAKNVYKLFSGTGIVGSGLGILGGGTLGILTGLMAPPLMNWGRDKLFGDDGDGNKGFLKGIGNALRNIPWVDKYLGMSTKAGDSDAMLIQQTLSDMDSEIELKINELSEMGDSMTLEEKRTVQYLTKLRATLQHQKKNLLSNPPIKRKNNETDEEYGNRLKDNIIKHIDKVSQKGKKDKNSIMTEVGESLKTKFNEKLDGRTTTRDMQRETGRDISSYSFDYNIANKKTQSEIDKITDPTQRALMQEILNSAKDEKGEGSLRAIATVLGEKIDSDGTKKDRSNEFEKRLDEIFNSDADDALVNNLSDNDIELLKNKDYTKFIESIMKDEDKADVIRELFDIGSLSADFMDEKDIELIRAVAMIRARALSNDPDNDKDVGLEAERISQTIMSMLNKKNMEYKVNKGMRGFVGKIKQSFAKVTGDTGVLDGDDRAQELELINLLRESGILKDEGLAQAFKEDDERKQAELREAALEDDDSGSGSKQVKMKDLKQYKFKDGRSLDTTGCSVATLNNMLISMGIGAVNINDLIKIANNHLRPDGSIDIKFYHEVSQRFGFKLKEYNKRNGTITDKVFLNNKPNKSRGVIILKSNPGMNYGHFVELCKINTINDPEVNGLTSVSMGDLLLMSDVVLVFERSTEKTLEAKIVDKVKSKIKSTTGIDVDNMFGNRTAKNQTTSSVQSISSGTDNDSSNVSTFAGVANRILELLENGIINVRLVDDLMLPLKLTDGTVAKYIGDRRRKTKDSYDSYSKMYDKARESDVAKKEYNKADMVQDAIISGFATSGAGTGRAAGANGDTSMNPDATNNPGGGGIVEAVVAGGVVTAAKAGWKAIKNKFTKKTAETVTKKGTEALVQEGAEKGVSKLGPKLVKGARNFFAKILKKSPKFLRPYIAKIGTKIFTMSDSIIKKFIKFTASAKTAIQKKVAKNTALGVATKIPFLDIALGVVAFGFSFASGYKDAHKILKQKPEDVDTLTKVGIGFAKGVSVALPGFLINKILPPSISGWAGAAFEIFMEMYGFNMLVEWFLNTVNGKDVKDEDGNVPTEEDLSKAEDEATKQDEKIALATTQKDEKSAKGEDFTSEEANTDGSGDPTLSEEKRKERETSLNETPFYDPTVRMDNITSFVPSKAETVEMEESNITKEKEEEKKTEEDNVDKKAPAITNVGDYVHPLNDPNRVITSAYGPRNGKLHSGIDFRGKKGDPIYAIKDGKVIYVDGRWGFVRVRHSDGSVSGYMHMNSIAVKVGQEVKAGEILGTVGGRGPGGPNAYGDHLHFDYQAKSSSKENPFKNNNKIDPIRALSLDPNNLKLAPASQSRENIAYLSRHKDMMAKINNNTNVASASNGGKEAKGGVDMMELGVESELNKTLQELSSNIKGIKIPNTLGSAGGSTPGELMSVQLLQSISTSLSTLVSIVGVQTKKLDAVTAALNNLKVDTGDMDAFQASRLNSSF